MLARFGERLVCVRYRYDEARSLRFTSGGAYRLAISVAAAQALTRIAYDDIALRAKITTLGALRRPRHKLWELPWGAVQAPGIEHRVISDTRDKPDKPKYPTPNM